MLWFALTMIVGFVFLFLSVAKGRNRKKADKFAFVAMGLQVFSILGLLLSLTFYWGYPDEYEEVSVCIVSEDSAVDDLYRGYYKDSENNYYRRNIVTARLLWQPFYKPGLQKLDGPVFYDENGNLYILDREKNCADCGNALDARDSVCPNCGRKIR